MFPAPPLSLSLIHISLVVCVCVCASMQPFVLFGVHSSKQCIEENNESCSSLKNSGHGGSHARHLVLQCICPKSFLLCTRTYFLGRATFPHLGNNEQEEDPVLRVLHGVYKATVEAVLFGISLYSQSDNITKLSKEVEEIFLSSLDNNGLPTYKDVLLPKMDFYIITVGDGKRNVPVDEEAHHFSLKNAKMTVWDVPDLDHGMGILGSVMFSETFLDSRITARDSDGSHYMNSHHVVLTVSIPRYANWKIGETDVSDLENSWKLGKVSHET
uniref:DAAF9 pita-bread-like domain-containing protein n=1 Tax=Eptatretus burgeri TaxID=7764 RepID=A0A8C4Q2D4_EPTBU